MKLNVGDLVELLYDGTTFSGVITAVTPERVELAFTLNIFVEGPGRITWPNGESSEVDVGTNALTKLHVRLPLEEVARAYAASDRAEPTSRPSAATPGSAQPGFAGAQPGTSSSRDNASNPAASLAAPASPVASHAVPPAAREPAAGDLREPEALLPPEEASLDRPGEEPADLESLLAGIDESGTAIEAGGQAGEMAEGGPATTTPGSAEPDGPDREEGRPEPRKREGVWVEYEALVDGIDLASGDLFPASLVLVSSTGCLLRAMGPLGIGDRIQLRFTLGRDTFDLASTVVYQEGPGVFEVAYDTLPSEVRVRMLRAVLGLAKPELRTQESWTYKLRQKGSG